MAPRPSIIERVVNLNITVRAACQRGRPKKRPRALGRDRPACAKTRPPSRWRDRPNLATPRNRARHVVRPTAATFLRRRMCCRMAGMNTRPFRGLVLRRLRFTIYCATLMAVGSFNRSRAGQCSAWPQIAPGRRSKLVTSSAPRSGEQHLPPLGSSPRWLAMRRPAPGSGQRRGQGRYGTPGTLRRIGPLTARHIAGRQGSGKLALPPPRPSVPDGPWPRPFAVAGGDVALQLRPRSHAPTTGRPVARDVV